MKTTLQITRGPPTERTMENSRLSPELQYIVDQFDKFRNEYSTLKTRYATQEEIIRLQKMELRKMNSRVEQLSTALLDYQKRCNVTMNNLELENRRLQGNVDKSSVWDVDNACTLEVLRRHVRSLEDELATLRSRVNSENEKHEEQIDAMRKRHDEEITSYKRKLEENNNTVQKSIPPGNKRITYTHPALDEDDESTKCKRKKKSTPAAIRWPQLDFVVKKEIGATQRAVSQKKKKKLYQPDKDAIVDLTL